MPRPRLLSVAVLALLFILAAVTGPAALAASPRTHAQTRAHRATRCSKLARRRSHRSRGARSKRQGRAGCVKHHASPTRHAGRLTPAAKKHTRSRSADDGCPNAALQPSAFNLESIRAATLCLVNRERAAHGENALRADAHMQQAAQGHTESMVEDDYFSHIGPRGETLLQRMHSSGYIYSPQLACQVAENIAWGTSWLGTPKAIVATWMASPEHRANILDPRYKDTGIGVSPDPPSSIAGGQLGGVYTQDFGVLVAG